MDSCNKKAYSLRILIVEVENFVEFVDEDALL